MIWDKIALKIIILNLNFAKQLKFYSYDINNGNYHQIYQKDLSNICFDNIRLINAVIH